MSRNKGKKENPPVRLLGTMSLLVLGLVAVYATVALGIYSLVQRLVHLEERNYPLLWPILILSVSAILGVVLAILMAAGLVGATVVFAIVAQPFAAHRAENMGVSRETYLRRQRIWAVVGAIIAVAIVAFATWYNLDLRPTLDTWA